ncbi:MAG: hypothetical protein K2N54_06235, partial [Helicobacter sp.]|nr:hypothetical protein [Helicobacter sp.]
MQIAIKGLTNDYAQYLQDKLDARRPKISEKELQEMRIRHSNQAELQEAKVNLQGKGIINKETIEMALHLGGIIGNIKSYQYDSYLRGAAITNDLISETGNRSTIDTPFGEMKIGVRFDEKTTLYLDNLAQLASFDVNEDGVVDSNDLSAKNLVLIGYDKDGAEIEMSLLDVLGGVELTQFFNNPRTLNGGITTVLRPEESHLQLKKENIVDFFEAYANKEGWIDFTDPDIMQRILSENDLDLSYRKKTANGSYRLERIHFPVQNTPAYKSQMDDLRRMQADGERFFGWEYHAAKSLRNAGKDYIFNSNDTGALERLKNGSMSYEYDSHLRLMNGYNPSSTYEDKRDLLQNVIQGIEETNMHNGSRMANDLAHSFYKSTGMTYSESNLAKAKEGLENGGVDFLETLHDVGGDFNNYVIGMQLNDIAGSITMLFSSGKEIKIALEDLYSGNGELNVDTDGNRASLMNEAREMSQEDLNNLDFAQVGIKDESGTIVSLKDLGITAIQKATYPDGRFLSFILTNADGAKINAQDLY